MRGFNQAHPRLSAARAFLAGAAILAGAAASCGVARAQEGSDDTAMALPRLSFGPGDGVGLPRPVAAGEARLLRAAFRDAAASVDGLQGSILLGHVLADRLLAAGARPALDDLRAWLDRYAELPDASAVHAAIVARQKRGAPPLPQLPVFATLPFGGGVEESGPVLPRNAGLDRSVHDAARAGQFDRAVRLVAGTRGLSAEYGALLRAEVAQHMFGQGRDREALRLAEAANRQAHGRIGLAPWVGGLAAWRLGRPELARTWFEAAHRAAMMPAGRRSAAAYWAARATLVTRGDHGLWMRRAAQDRRSFYGLLAARTLGQAIRPAEDPLDTLGAADLDAIGATGRGERAFALLQVGQPARAAAELRLLWSEMRDRPGFGRSVLVVARAAGLRELAGQLDNVLQPATVRLPAAKLRPNGGFRLDPALVHALARIESNFEPAAVSPAGARGLMQLMPGTAQAVLAGSRAGAARLDDPGTNLDLGQRYLLHLAGLETVGADLIRLLAAYNAGPGNFARWTEVLQDEQDPLLFLESLPLAETRRYVPRVLAYTWLYAAQLGLPSPTLDDLAAGLWPRLQVRPVRREPAGRLH